MGPSRARISAAFPLVKPCAGGEGRGEKKKQSKKNTDRRRFQLPVGAAGRLATQHQHGGGGGGRKEKKTGRRKQKKMERREEEVKELSQ